MNALASDEKNMPFTRANNVYLCVCLCLMNLLLMMCLVLNVMLCWRMHTGAATWSSNPEKFTRYGQLTELVRVNCTTNNSYHNHINSLDLSRHAHKCMHTHACMSVWRFTSTLTISWFIIISQKITLDSWSTLVQKCTVLWYIHM